MSIKDDDLISFCIVTGGKREEKLNRLIRSIRLQKIKNYEVIIAGNVHQREGVITLQMVNEAQNGMMGLLRNAAARASSGKWIVSLDDDIILNPRWWEEMKAFSQPWDIMTCRIILPDGSRFWDYATSGGPKGQKILNLDEQDDYLYMTGGGGWAMNRSVWETVSWDDQSQFYKGDGEDVSYSHLTRAAGYKPVHNPRAVVIHDDWKYTSFGRSIFIRKIMDEARDALRKELSRMTLPKIIERAQDLSTKEMTGDAFDALRLGLTLHFRNPKIHSFIQNVEQKFGGALKETGWFWDGDPNYWEIIRWADKEPSTSVPG